MVFDKLTRLASLRAQILPIAPVIVKVRRERFRDMIAILRDYEISAKVLRRGFFEFLKAPILTFGAFPMKAFPRFNMIAGLFAREFIFDLADWYDVERIFSDEVMTILQYPTVPAEGIYKATLMRKTKEFTSTFWTKQIIGATKANEQGFTGRGVTVAVVDTGVPRVHEQLMSAQFYTVMPMQQTDENGHGTHVASTIGGRYAIDDMMSRIVGRAVYVEGMAPEVRLYGIKALGYLIGTGSTSQIIDALHLAIELGVDIINMSLGGEKLPDTPEDDPYFHVFNELLANNIIPIVAAGNSGPNERTINTPGALPQALTVGAYDPITGEIADFSSRGPTPWDDIKPDCVAPGVDVNSACVNALDYTDGVPNRYSALSGTSMATPHVAGLVALMRQAHRELLNKILTVDEIKEMLQALGHEKTNDAGHGAITWNMYEEWLSTQYGAEIHGVHSRYG